MPRQARLGTPGILHHVIIRGIEKRHIVDDRTDQNAFVDRMGQTALETGVKIYAWVVMTNHAHILLKSGTEGKGAKDDEKVSNSNFNSGFLPVGGLRYYTCGHGCAFSNYPYS